MCLHRLRHMPTPRLLLVLFCQHSLSSQAFNINMTISLRAAMSWDEITFATFGGLRGAVSLILAQVVVTEQAPHSDLQNRKVTAQVRHGQYHLCRVVAHDRQ